MLSTKFNFHFFFFARTVPLKSYTESAPKNLFPKIHVTRKLLRISEYMLNKTCLKGQDLSFDTKQKGWPQNVGLKKSQKSFKHIFLPFNNLI